MLSFRGERLKKYAIPVGSVWLMTDIAQSKGRQELYARQAPQLLKVMRDMALVQSAESSNRIEGVTVQPDRLKPLGHPSLKKRQAPTTSGKLYQIRILPVLQGFQPGRICA